jgi:hypothetical protein
MNSAQLEAQAFARRMFIAYPQNEDEDDSDVEEEGDAPRKMAKTKSCARSGVDVGKSGSGKSGSGLNHEDVRKAVEFALQSMVGDARHRRAQEAVIAPAAVAAVAPPPAVVPHQQAVPPPPAANQLNANNWGNGPNPLFQTGLVIQQPGYPGGHLSQGRKAVISGQDAHSTLFNFFMAVGVPVVPVQDGFDVEAWDGTWLGQPVIRPICFQRCPVAIDVLDKNFVQQENVFRYVLVVPDRDELAKRRFYFIQTQRQYVQGSTVHRFEHVLQSVRNVASRAPNYWGIFVLHFENQVREDHEPWFNDAIASNPDRTRVLRLETFHTFVYHVLQIGKWVYIEG